MTRETPLHAVHERLGASEEEVDLGSTIEALEGPMLEAQFASPKQEGRFGSTGMIGFGHFCDVGDHCGVEETAPKSIIRVFEFHAQWLVPPDADILSR